MIMKKNWLKPEIDELTITATAGRGGNSMDTQSPTQFHPECWTPTPTVAASFDSTSGADISTPTCTSVPVSKPHWPHC